MTTLQQIIPKCIWKQSQESGKNYYLRCCECNGFPERAKEIKCDRYYTINIIKLEPTSRTSQGGGMSGA